MDVTAFQKLADFGQRKRFEADAPGDAVIETA